MVSLEQFGVVFLSTHITHYTQVFVYKLFTGLCWDSSQGAWCKFLSYGNVSISNLFKVCLAQRGMLTLKCGNKIIYLDVLGHKMWQSQRNTLHTVMLQKSQDVTRSPIATAARSQSATCALPHCPHVLKLSPKQWLRQCLSALGQCRCIQVAFWELAASSKWQAWYILWLS